MERSRIETESQYKVYGRIPKTNLVIQQGLTRSGNFIEVGSATDIIRLKLAMANKEYDFTPLITKEGVNCIKGVTELYIKVEDLPYWW